MTTDDLEQIKQLLEANNKQLRQELKGDIRAETGSLRQEFKRDLKAEIDPLHERLDAQRDQISRVEKNLSDKISQEANDVAEIIRDVIIPNLDRHEQQITKLQEEVNIKHHKH